MSSCGKVYEWNGQVLEDQDRRKVQKTLDELNVAKWYENI